MAAPLLPVIVQENWAQCENPNCNKWRRLPPHFEVKEDEPWYCYLNPDENKATCSASEDEYNEATMVELGPAGVDLDEAEQSRMIREQLTGKLLASSGLPMGAALPPLPIMPAGGGKGKGGRGRGRGKGRGKGRGGAAAAAAPGSQSDPYYQKRKSSGGPKYKEDSDEEFITDEDDLLPAPAAPRVRHQAPPATYARHFARLLENQGSWEPAQGQAVGGGATLSVPPTAEAWEGLGQHAPELAEVAVAAADVASSLQYFEAAPGSETAQACEAADAVVRLSAMLASAAGLVATHGEGLSQEQRRACCLDAAAAVKQEPLAAAVSALPPQALVLAGQPPGASALPFAMPPPQPGAAPLPGWQMPQPAAMVVQQQQQQQQQQPMQVQQAQQPMGLQIGGVMAQPAAGWPGMQLPFANGQQQQQQAQFMQQPMAGMQQAFGMQQALPQQMQQALPQQFTGMLPPQQWAMPGLAMPGSTPRGMPLAPGATGATVQEFMQLLQQKPGGQQQQQQQANGTQH